MNGLFLLLFLLSPVLLVIGLIKPKIFSRIYKKGLSRKQISLLFGGTAILSFVLFGVTTDVTTQDETPQAEINKSQESLEENQALGESTETVEEPKLDLVKVIRVIDGDTIEIDGGQKVRYIGIDTPETVDPREPVGCYGKESSDKNKELVLDKEVRLEKDVSETDKYGRLLRYVWVGDLMVNEYLVEEGYAMSSSYPPDIKYQERFVEAQRKAREENKGLWSSYCDSWNQPTNTPFPTIPKPTSTPAKIYKPEPTIEIPSGSCKYDCSGPDRDCADFSTQAEAQTFFNCCGFTITYDPMKLDGLGEDDGIACESLP